MECRGVYREVDVKAPSSFTTEVIKEERVPIVVNPEEGGAQREYLKEEAPLKRFDIYEEP
jgi:hypothetical protein